MQNPLHIEVFGVQSVIQLAIYNPCSAYAESMAEL